LSLLLTSVADRITRPVKAYSRSGYTPHDSNATLENCLRTSFRSQKPCLTVTDCAGSRLSMLSTLTYPCLRVSSGSSTSKHLLSTGIGHALGSGLMPYRTQSMTPLSFRRSEVANFSLPPACLRRLFVGPQASLYSSRRSTSSSSDFSCLRLGLRSSLDGRSQTQHLWIGRYLC
jgi:hypothetical protein